MDKNQIGYSLIFVETLKPYNEKTKRFEPLKIKRVEVCQELSEFFSNDEKAKNMMFDKMFDYKEDIKQLLDNNEYGDIPSYHKESLEKDQKIADLEAKLDEKTRIAEGYSELFDKRQHENYEQFCEIQELKAKLAEKEKMHLLDEKQWQDYCAYKIIESQIKGCLDRERAYLNFFENFETNVNLIIAHNPRLDKCGIVKEIIYYVEQQLKSVKGEINNE